MRRWILRLALLSIVAAIIPACGLDGTGVTTGGPPGSVGVNVSALQMLARGGNGSTFTGGQGGQLNVNGSTGSDLRIIPAGAVNSLITPRLVAPDLGANPRRILANTTYTIGAASLTAIPAGAQTILGDDGITPATGLYVAATFTLNLPANRDTNVNPALPGGFYDSLRLNFANGVHIEGTVRIGFQDRLAAGDGLGDDCAGFVLNASGNVVVAPTGTINLNGRDDSAGGDADTIGGQGGIFTNDLLGELIFGSFPSPPPFFPYESYSLTQAILLAGQILAKGGLGEQGGSGGIVFLAAEDYGLYHSGTIDVGGAAGTVAGFTARAAIASVAAFVAGNTDYTLEAVPPAWITATLPVTVVGCTNGVNNVTNANVVAVAGNVVTLVNGSGVLEAGSPGEILLGGNRGRAGAGGTIHLRSNREAISSDLPGGLFNTGSLLARGADGTVTGGTGGRVILDSGLYGDGALTSSGTIDASAGNALVANGNGAGGSGAGSAGWPTTRTAIDLLAGGTLRVTGTVTARGGNGAGTGIGGAGGSITMRTQSSSMAVGATLNSSGGDGASGGNAGMLDFYSGYDSTTTPGSETLWIIGYAEINTSGGNGPTDGGDAGSISIYNDSSSFNSVTSWGSIRNEVVLNAVGGNGTSGDGGSGGSLNLQNASAGPSNNRSVTNIAAINLSGGTGGAQSGNGGTAYVYDTFKVENSGTITANGGSATAGTGGDAGTLQLVSDDIVMNTAVLSANGGVATGPTGIGGWGGQVLLQSRTTTCNANLNARGANGGMQGGTGGYIELFSTETITAVNGTLSVTAGTPPGAIFPLPQHGRVRLDGLNLQLTGGQITLP